jgi:hypothetical protein
MGNKNNGMRIKKDGQMCDLFFVKPERSFDAHKSVEELLKLEDIDEVFLTTGMYGFVVRARSDGGENHRKIARYINNKVGRCFRLASHVQYKRR